VGQEVKSVPDPLGGSCAVFTAMLHGEKVLIIIDDKKNKVYAQDRTGVVRELSQIEFEGGCIKPILDTGGVIDGIR